MFNGRWKFYYGFENKCKSTNLWLLDKKKLMFETLVISIILYGCVIWACIIYRESQRRMEKVQKIFITYNINIQMKLNRWYPIILIEVSLFPTESMDMTM